MITLTDAKLHLKLATTAEGAAAYTYEDVAIQRLINGAYLTAEQRTQRSFAPATKTLVLNGFPVGSGKIELPWTPVTAIESLEFIDPEGVEQSLDAETLRLDTRPILPTLAPQWGAEWPRTTDETECITITASVGQEETPPDVEIALLMLIAHHYVRRQGVAEGGALQEVPMGVEMLLEPYRIHAVG